MKKLANIEFFTSLQNSRKKFFVFNDDIAIKKNKDIDKLQELIESWNDEIEDMRSGGGSNVEPEAVAEEDKQRKLLKQLYDRVDAAVSACRIAKSRLLASGVDKDDDADDSKEAGGSDEDMFGGFGGEEEAAGGAESDEDENEE